MHASWWLHRRVGFEPHIWRESQGDECYERFGVFRGCRSQDAKGAGALVRHGWNGRCMPCGGPLGVKVPDVAIPPDNPQTKTKVELGLQLIFDTRLSKNDSISCTGCHVPHMAARRPRREPSATAATPSMLCPHPTILPGSSMEAHQTTRGHLSQPRSGNRRSRLASKASGRTTRLVAVEDPEGPRF